MKQITYPIALAISLLSTNAFAENFQFHVEKFPYQVPQKVVNACTKAIQKAKEKENPKTACMSVNLDILKSNYDWANKILNKEYENPQKLKKDLDETANDVLTELQETDIWNYHRFETSSELQQLSISPRFIQIMSENYDYTGGVHGMPSLSFFVLDTQLKKELKVNDILTNPKQKQSLEKLALKSLKNELKQKHQESGEKFTEQDWQNYISNWQFELNDNFYFTPTSLNFSYDPYALQAYAFGFFTLKIDKKDLIGIIKPEYLNQTLNQFNQKAVNN